MGFVVRSRLAANPSVVAADSRIAGTRVPLPRTNLLIWDPIASADRRLHRLPIRLRGLSVFTVPFAAIPGNPTHVNIPLAVELSG